MKLRFLFASMVLFLASTHTWAISNVFTYQGALTDAGNPANGVYDFQFQLKDAANANVGTPITREDVQVTAGVFTVELDFGTAITSSDFKMEIGVRPGASTDPHQVLAPLTALRPSPQAQIAGMAVEAATVSPGGVTNAMLANDAVTSAKLAPSAVSNSDLADGAVGASKVVSGEVQLRVGGTCAEGSSVRLINADGTVTCETDDNNAGGVTSVATGAGLTGGPITTSGTIAADTTYLQRRVSSSCAAGSSISAIADDGTVTCESDDTGTGTVSSVASGTGLTGGPITTTGTLSIASGGVTSNMISDGSIVAADVNTTSVQARVSGTCAAGSSIQSIGTNGSVVCEPDDNGTNAWNLTGNGGTNPNTHYLGTTDNQPVHIRSFNQNVSRMQANALTIGFTANIINGSPANNITAGVRGATIAGGGVPSGDSDPNHDFENPNRVTDHYGFVGGGYDNRAGDDAGQLHDKSFATVVGGQSNFASGLYSTVAGGYANTASGEFSNVAGGSHNCAGGSYSWAGGRDAKVRPSSTSGGLGTGCNPVTPSGDPNGDEGTFVWADTRGFIFESTGPNQFLVRASGGVVFNGTVVPEEFDDFVFYPRYGVGDDVDFRLVSRIGRDAAIYLDDSTGTVGINPRHVVGSRRFEVLGGTGGAAFLTAGGAWTNASSRTYKENFAPSDGVEVLEKLVSLPIGTWTYIGSDEGTHLGPMAEDFKAAFGLAGDGKSIGTVDADGVALAAIQGLNQKLESENAILKSKTEHLEQELKSLKAIVQSLQVTRGE